jgi:hypothetical protein
MPCGQPEKCNEFQATSQLSALLFRWIVGKIHSSTPLYTHSMIYLSLLIKKEKEKKKGKSENVIRTILHDISSFINGFHRISTCSAVGFLHVLNFSV